SLLDRVLDQAENANPEGCRRKPSDATEDKEPEHIVGDEEHRDEEDSLDNTGEYEDTRLVPARDEAHQERGDDRSDNTSSGRNQIESSEHGYVMQVVLEEVGHDSDTAISDKT